MKVEKLDKFVVGILLTVDELDEIEEALSILDSEGVLSMDGILILNQIKEVQQKLSG